VTISFDERLEPYRPELFAHCYRMLGSVHDAEDVVQDTYLRAWRARDSYDESRASLRTWMYRIATNACLNARETDSRRPLPSGYVAASQPMAPLVRGAEVTWLQPLPDAMIRDPAETAIDRSSIRLAFVAALQHLSARQRAVLLLRDVLDFSAAETAEILGSSVASVNSALQRARATMAASGANADVAEVPTAAEQRAVVDRYMAAFVAADVDAIARLLANDVLMEMPPMVNWFTGTEGYVQFMRWMFDVNGADWRVLPMEANGQSGFAAYRAVGGSYTLHTLQILTIRQRRVTRLSVFQDEKVFASFGLEPLL
jgi:RNA polymerase sigma-70 factor (ECF subfamily)